MHWKARQNTEHHWWICTFVFKHIKTHRQTILQTWFSPQRVFKKIIFSKLRLKVPHPMWHLLQTTDLCSTIVVKDYHIHIYMVPQGDSKNTMICTHTKHGIMMVNILKHHESFMLAHTLLMKRGVIFCPGCAVLRLLSCTWFIGTLIITLVLSFTGLLVC